MRESEVADEQWKRIEPLLPPHGRMGRPRVDDRKVVEGILCVLRTGCRWQDMPRRYGAYVTAWRSLRRWEDEGVWEGIGQALLGTLDQAGKVEWTRAFLDGSFVPAKRGSGADEGRQGDTTDARNGRERDPSWSSSRPTESCRDQAGFRHDGAGPCTSKARTSSKA